jgi:hypothetical protein
MPAVALDRAAARAPPSEGAGPFAAGAQSHSCACSPCSRWVFGRPAPVTDGAKACPTRAQRPIPPFLCPGVPVSLPLVQTSPRGRRPVSIEGPDRSDGPPGLVPGTVDVQLRSGQLELRFVGRFTPTDLERLKAIRGRRWDSHRRVWLLPHSAHVVDALRRSFGLRLAAPAATPVSEPAHGSGPVERPASGPRPHDEREPRGWPDGPEPQRPRDAPAGRRPCDEPAGRRPRDEQIARHPRDEPAARRPRDEPAGRRPRHELAARRPRDEPAGRRPRDEPAGRRPRDEPAGRRPRDELAARRPRHEPAGQPLRDSL